MKAAFQWLISKAHLGRFLLEDASPMMLGARRLTFFTQRFGCRFLGCHVKKRKEAKGMSEWQTIETAPKDGTPVLLCGGGDDSEKHVSGHEAFFRSPCRAKWDGNGWLMGIAEAGFTGIEYENPTHWMPIPKPPQSPHTDWAAS